MAIDTLIIILVLVLAGFIALRVLKKFVKMAVTAIIILFIVIMATDFFLKLDAEDFSNDLANSIYIYENKLGYELPFAPLQKEKLQLGYEELIGNKSRILVFSEAALRQLQPDLSGLSQGDYMQQVAEFKKIVEGNNSTLLLLRLYRNKSIYIYPASPLLSCAEKCPDFLLRRYAK